MKCYKCNAEISAEAKFCDKCGAPQEFTKELIEDAKGKNQEAIAELYNRTYNNVYFTVKSMIKDEDTVMDILQDTYLKAFASLGQLQDAAKFRAWIKRIAHNRTIDYLRKAKPVMFSQMSTDSEDVVEFEDDNAANLPEVVIDRKETARLMKEIMDVLPAEQRVVIAMHYYEGLSVKEIAETLGVTEGTIKSRLNYGRKKIETQVEDLKKKGTNLYSLAPMPFLLLLFKNQNAYAAEMASQAVLRKVLSSTVQSGVGKLAVSQAVKSGAKAAAGTTGKAFGTKMIVGIAAVAVIGGTAAGIMIHNNSNKAESETVVEETVVEESETPEEGNYYIVSSNGDITSARDYEGQYTSTDIGSDVVLNITAVDDQTVEIRITSKEHNVDVVKRASQNASWGLDVDDGYSKIDACNKVFNDPWGGTIFFWMPEEYLSEYEKELGTRVDSFYERTGPAEKSQNEASVTDGAGETENASQPETQPSSEAAPQGVDLAQYDGWSYYEGDHVRYQLSTADGGLTLGCWFLNNEQEYYETDYTMDLSTADISGNTYRIYNVSDEYQDISFKFTNLQFIFNGDSVEMIVDRDINFYAGGEGNNLNTGSYILTR
ncbi:MAG: sigma-70 family RNA polymerase sigma factor [Clostridia bacterium]|nr:sigma-70 family RNA polymerase sigma factor [Lachnospiraceae bacterium]NCC00757.1 sigma-70 family RNA polymerase sigma factor [Clostridia bacterium]NCD03121.1 sigma-70 family RNA polymerase sigma factor [Clostridia bacterium]